MEADSFRLNIVTPTGKFEREITHIRLRDESGYFGVMKGHIDFLTVLVPSLCYYRDTGGREVFLAVDAGIFSVRRGAATLAAREVFESEDAEKLADIIENTFLKRRTSEESVRRMLGDIEKSFMEKTIELLRSAS
ncbi:MAG TPA: F0F1 ATP synthase subunit epsilon [Geobacteraceae bacterium]|nr:F0F1 ATP synthase subunit epsilon [Geobacteraceae bacterium]